VLQHYIEDQGSMRAIDGGEWPHAAQTPQPIRNRRYRPHFDYERRLFNAKHPDAIVEYMWNVHPPCARLSFQTFIFDDNEKVLKIEETPARDDCW
jgi:hypothetical protein